MATNHVSTKRIFGTMSMLAVSGLLIAVGTGCGGDLRLGNLFGLADSKQSSVEYEIVPAVECSDVARPTQPAGPVTPRPWSSETVFYQNGALEHSPLYVSGPFAEPADADARFQTWSIQDVVALAASPAVFVANVVATPVLAVITPPWQSQYSRSVFGIQEPASAIPVASGSYQ